MTEYDVLQFLLTAGFDLLILVGIGLFVTACVRAVYAQKQHQQDEEFARYRAAATALNYLLKNLERSPDGYILSIEVLTQARKLYRQQD